MRLVIDSSGPGEDALTARAYVAAVLGNRRRPNGRSVPLGLVANTATLVAENNTTDRALAVSVGLGQAANALVAFASDSATRGVSVNLSPAAVPFFDCVLLPGESLYATCAAAAALTVYTERY